uniref:Uncharacterized protein n=1 Tax=Arundo donax TaxID=35708 RepID=A0A0A8ZMN8_ARUDO
MLEKVCHATRKRKRANSTKHRCRWLCKYMGL